MDVLKNIAGTTLTNLGFAAAPTVTASSTASSDDADGPWLSITTSTANGNDAVITNFSVLRRDWDPEFYTRVKTPATITNLRYWIGLFSADPTGSATPAVHAAGFRFDTGVPDTKWQFCTGDGTTTACTDTGVTVSASTAYTLGVTCSASDCKGYVNGTLSATRTTNLPGATTTIGYNVSASNLSAAAHSLLFGRLTVLHK
jgi:hypothetical protein